MDFVAGIDVAGQKKGFHLAVKHARENRWHSFIQFFEPQDVTFHLHNLQKALSGNCLCIAVDSPPQASVGTKSTRIAERELHSDGYRIQWTPRDLKKEIPWMKNGERLWNELRRSFPGTSIVESFPTAAGEGLYATRETIPLNIFFGRHMRDFTKDYVDAAVCALVAERSARGETKLYGPSDPLGPIHSARQPVKHMTLGFIHTKERVLLGKKKRGFGVGLWNGFGGKIRAGETDTNAMIRELLEEADLEAQSLEQQARLLFSFHIFEELLDVRVFHITKYSGQPKTTEEMEPKWFQVGEIPYENMWPDDQYWLPFFLNGRKFTGHFAFGDEKSLLHYNMKMES